MKIDNAVIGRILDTLGIDINKLDPIELGRIAEEIYGIRVIALRATDPLFARVCQVWREDNKRKDRLRETVRRMLHPE